MKAPASTFFSVLQKPFLLRSGLAIAVGFAFFTTIPQEIVSKLYSANLSNVSVVMSNSKLSFVGKLASGNSVGSSVVSIATSGAPSTSSANLFPGDTVWIGDGATGSTYTVSSVVSSGTADNFKVSTALDATDADAGDLVIASRSATLTLNVTTTGAISNGAIRVLVPAAANSSVSSDGLPDTTGFDYGTATPTVTCPTDTTGYDFVTGTATATAVTIGSTTYHAYTCRYSGTGATSTQFNASTTQMSIASVINPAPNSTHTVGTADPYKIIVQNLNGSALGDVAIDSTTVTVAPIEAVRVTASVAPILQFSIGGVASSTSICGTTTNVTTTPSLVPFGELAISSFMDAAQTFGVSTNAQNGYAVTARENDQLTRLGTASCVDAGTDGYGAGNSCIPDVSTGFSESGTGVEWNSTTSKGFGYTLQYIGGNGTFAKTNLNTYYDAGGSSCGAGGKFCARKFADAQNGEAAQTLFSYGSTSDSHNVAICYRAVVASNQESGDYENNITYTATAVF